MLSLAFLTPLALSVGSADDLTKCTSGPGLRKR